MQREICECSNLRVTFGLSEAARASQRGAIATAYKQAVKARDEAPSCERYTPITSGLTACSGWAGRDFKLIVGSALVVTMAKGGRPSLDIIVVKTRGGDGQGYCVLVTEAGAERIKAVACSMTFEAAERARASKPPTGAEAEAAKHALEALAELGLTNVLGLALPDTRKLTSEQVGKVLAATWGIRKATVEGGDGLWAAITRLAQAVDAAAPTPSLAVAAAEPQLVGVAAPPALAGPGDASDAETEVGGTEGDGPSGGEAALPSGERVAGERYPTSANGTPVRVALVRTGAHYDALLHRDDQGEWRPAPRRSARLTHPDGGRGGGGGGGGGGDGGGGSGEGGGGGGGDGCGEGGGLVAPETAAPATTRASRKRKAGAASGGGAGSGGDSVGDGGVSSEAVGDGDGGTPRAAPTAQAPTATAKVRRTRGAASADQPAVAVEAQADAPAQAPPLAAPPPTPEEATQRLQAALASSDEAAAALALEALEGVVKTKDTLHNTSAMRLPNTHANTRAPPPRHLVPNRRGQGRQRAPPQQGHAGGAALARQGAVGEVEGARVTRVCAPSRWGARGSSITAMTRTRRPRSGRGCYSRTGWTPSSAPEAALEEDWSRGVYGEGERGRKLPNRK